MGTDDGFERRLGARLRLAVDDVRCPPGLGAVVRRQHRRQVLAVRTAMVTPAAAAVAVMALSPGSAVRPANSPGTTAGRAATTGTTDLYDARLVSARAASALADISRYVIGTHAVNNGYVTDSLADPVTGRTRHDSYDPRGARLTTIGLTPGTSGGLDALVADHQARAWWTWTAPPDPGPGRSDGRVVSTYSDPTQIRDALRDGTIRVIGEETLNGHDTLHLRCALPRGSLSPVLDLWVDTATYLPYRSTTTSTRPEDGGRRYTVDFTWQARTPAHLRQLVVTPPAGFTRHAKPIEPTPSGTPRG
jgi:hypothetical protein